MPGEPLAIRISVAGESQVFAVESPIVQRQPFSAEASRSRPGGKSSTPEKSQVLWTQILARKGLGSHSGQDNGVPATSASRTCQNGAETPEKQGRNDTDVSVCPRVCPNCCRALSIAGKATSDALTNMASALQELIAQTDCSGNEEDPKDCNTESAGGAFLEVIRLLTKMAPEERAAMIGLLKALG
jgi:hypothetical protein